MASAGHIAVVIEGGIFRARAGTGDEVAIVNVQELNDLSRYAGDERRGRCR